jgi:NAD(P)H dehydrogenase (quinone)
MRALFSTPPIPYRMQNGGDYFIPQMQLKPGLEKPGTTGFALHSKD